MLVIDHIHFYTIKTETDLFRNQNLQYFNLYIKLKEIQDGASFFLDQNRVFSYVKDKVNQILFILCMCFKMNHSLFLIKACYDIYIIVA